MIATYRFGSIELQPEQRLLLVEGRPAALGPRAFDVLLALVERAGKLVSKNQLLDLVWPGLVVEENNLQVQISTLRKLLGQQAIATVPGRGYRWVAAVGAGGPESGAGGAGADTVAPQATQEPAKPARPSIPALPIQLIGREADLEVLGALAAAHRLVTIVGPGGVGKTRTAQALAGSRGHHFVDGAVWVDLAALADPATVPAAVATAAGATPGPSDEPVGALVEALKSRSLLIVFDNAEPMIDATARIVQRLLQATSRVSFLVTSQVPLKIAAEHVYRLGTLQVPDPTANAEQALATSAVALFIERATASARGLRLSDADVAQVGEICRHLDGLPLAIELAAARVALLGLPALVRNIDQRFRLLGSGDRTAPVRQQTLKAAFDWSYDLMTLDAQIVFRRLGVFAGSFTLEAAREVVADDRIDEWSVVELLAELIDRSLVAVDNYSDPRYRLLETGRAFAIEKLHSAGELERLHDRHACAMARLAEQGFDDFWSVSDAEMLGRYVPDLDNLRAALKRTASSNPEMYARIAAGTMLLLRRLSLTREASAIAQTAEALPTTVLAPVVQARLWLGIALTTYQRDDALRAIEIHRQLGDERGLYLSLYPFVHQINPGPEEITAAAQEAQRLRRPDWPPKLEAIGLGAQGWAALRVRDLTQASRLLGDAIRLCDAAGADDFGTALRMQLYEVTFAAGDLAAARAESEAVLERCHRLKNAYRLTCTQAFMVNVHLAQGSIASARQIAAEFAAFDRALGWPHACEIADALSLLAAHGGRFDDAARLAGFADKVHANRGSDVRDPASECSRQRLAQMLQENLDSTQISKLKSEGARLDIDRATGLSLDTP